MEETKHPQHQYVLLLATVAFLVLQSLPLKAQTVLESIQETGILKVAVREDAAPFGYLDSTGQLQGYCLDFLALLESKLKQHLPRNTIEIKLLKSTASNRFQLVEQGLIDLECGPNTVQELSFPTVTFSRTFFITRTKFLIARKNRKRFDFYGDLANVTLGVIRNTSSEQLIRERYPSAKLLLFSGTTARNRGVQAVTQGKIDAMVSDGILLRAEAAKEKLAIDDYILIPETDTSSENSVFNQRDRYGMIIKGQDPQWLEFVNAAISSQESQQLFKRWFDSIESFPTQLTDLLDFKLQTTSLND